MKIAALVSALLLSGAAFSQDRIDEIWTHATNRFVDQMDQSFEDGDFPFVISMLRVSYADEPNNYETATNLGWMLENVQEWQQAEDFYKQFIKDNPGNPEAAYPLGFFYYMRKRYSEAEAVLEPTLTKAVHPNTFRILAKCYEREQRYKDAIRVWELQIKKWPDDLPAKANIDRVKKKMG
jgi:tetratricopeptide (TPR) repeat protein